MKDYLIGGIRATLEAIEQGRVQALKITNAKKTERIQRVIDAAKNIPVEFCPPYQLDMELPNVRHQGVIALCTGKVHVDSWQDAIHGKSLPFVLVLDSIQDPHNLGACLRSALAAGVDAVIFPKDRAANLTAVARSVACGAAEILPIFAVTNISREIEALKKQGIVVIGGAGETEKSIYDCDLNIPLALVVGNEGDGLRHGVREHCDFLAKIPLNPQMESLNVSVACGILLFEAVRQRL